jgi:hypothetical protein
MRAIALMLMLFGMADAARAQWDFTLDPPQAQDGGAVSIVVNDATGCFQSDGFSTIVRDGNTVTATAWIDDSIPPGTPPGTCPPQWVTPNHFSLGTFTTGSYEVRVVICTNSPAPEPCATEATLQLLVFGAGGTRFSVPTLSSAVMILLVFSILIGVHLNFGQRFR